MRSYGQGLEDVGRGCGTGAVCERIAGMLERCDCLLEVVSVGVGGTRVLVYAYGLAYGVLCESSRKRNLLAVSNLRLHDSGIVLMKRTGSITAPVTGS